MSRFLLGLVLSFLVGAPLFAGSACCAAKGDLPSLITDHSQSQFSLSLTGSTVIGSSDSRGESEFYHSEKFDRSMIVSGSVTTKLTDQFQFGASFPFVMKSSRDLNRRSRARGIGDPSLSVGYELVGHHHQSLPQTFLAFSLGIPAGQAAEDSGLSIPDAAPGSGHWTIQGGVISLQSWNTWSGSFQALGQYSIPEEFSSSTQRIKLSPGWNVGAKLKGGRGFFQQKLYLGLGLGPKWQQAQIREDVFGSTRKGYRLAWNTSVEANWILMDELAVSISYNDQTLLGPTKRSPLTRSVGLGLQARQ